MKPSIWAITTLCIGLSMIVYAYFRLSAVDTITAYNADYASTNAYFASISRFGRVGVIGAIVCLIGCVRIGVTWSTPSLVQAGLGSVIGSVAVFFFGLFIFNVHGATGALYPTVVGLVLGAGLSFLFIAGVQYIRQFVSHRR